MSVVVAVEKVGELLAAVGAINDIVELITKLVENPAVKAAIGLGQAGASAVKTGVDYIRQRADQQRYAARIGTTTQTVDRLSRTYEGLGSSAEEAVNDVTRFASAMDGSFAKAGKGLAWVERLGVKSTDKKGFRLDTGEVFSNVLEALADRAKNIDRLEADGRAGKKLSPRERAQLIADQRALAAASSEFFKENSVVFGGLKTIGGSRNLKKVLDNSLKRQPLIPSEVDADYLRVDAKNRENDQIRGRINDTEQANRLRAALSKAISDRTALDKTLETGNEDSSIPMTEEEVASNRSGYVPEFYGARSLVQNNKGRSLDDEGIRLRGQTEFALEDYRRAMQAWLPSIFKNVPKEDYERRYKAVETTREQLLSIYSQFREYMNGLNLNAFGNRVGRDVNGTLGKRSDNSGSAVYKQEIAVHVAVTSGPGASEIANKVAAIMPTAAGLFKAGGPASTGNIESA